MSFLIYDLSFLFLFLVVFSIFLYRRRRKLDREGLLILHRTEWGINLINKVGNKYRKTLRVLSHFSVFIGYILMVGAIYMIYSVVKIYVLNPSVVRAIKVPPIMPLVPYLPQVLKLDFLPPFYFTYWILIIAVIAITHEFAHGIFASYNKVKIKKTGFGFFPFFLPIFLAAFVELDEKKMSKKPKFSQMAILSAGTFANILTGILFFFILIIFFGLMFAPAGVIFDSYATSVVAISSVTSIKGIGLDNASYEKILSLTDENLTEITAGGKSYLATKETLEQQKGKDKFIYLYNSAPAIKNNLSSIISEINSIKIKSIDELVGELSKYKPGEKILIKTIEDEKEKEMMELVLEENPEKEGVAWLGIGFFDKSGSSSGFFGKFVSKISSFREPNVYYSPKIEGISVFVYNLIWWVILISFSVALINMLPVGIFDGGRFFYLTILAITKNEKIAKNSFKISTYLFLFLVFLLMFFWVLGIV